MKLVTVIINFLKYLRVVDCKSIHFEVNFEIIIKSVNFDKKSDCTFFS